MARSLTGSEEKLSVMKWAYTESQVGYCIEMLAWPEPQQCFFPSGGTA